MSSAAYGEAQAAESRRDFIHKMTISLKELRETRISLEVISRKKYLKDDALVQKCTGENEQLIAIFVKSIGTARKNGSKN